MQLIRSGHGMAALLGVALAMMAVTALADEIVLKPPRNAADIIRGHGGPDGLTQGDIRNYVALIRAEARAKALQPFLRADLDGDGAVNLIEAEVYSSSLSARSRSWFGYAYDLADLDLDGVLTVEEVSGAGIAAALDAVDDNDEAALTGLLALDSDGNGAVNLDELRQGLARASMLRKPVTEDEDA